MSSTPRFIVSCPTPVPGEHFAVYVHDRKSNLTITALVTMERQVACKFARRLAERLARPTPPALPAQVSA